jgi:hypothetical protein
MKKRRAVPLADPGARLLFEPVEEIVGFHTDPFAPRHLE